MRRSFSPFLVPKKSTQQTTMQSRPQTFRRPKKIFVAIGIDLVQFLLLVGCGWTLAMLISSEGERHYGMIFLKLFAVWLVVFIGSKIYRRHILCPLCLGTVLKTQRCKKHKKARRIFFLTHKATAILDILTRLRFTCMYCGCRFRLGK